MAPCTRVLTILLTLISTATSVSPVAACPPGGRFCPSRSRSAYRPPVHQSVHQPAYHPAHRSTHEPVYHTQTDAARRLAPPTSHVHANVQTGSQAHLSVPLPRAGKKEHATLATAPPPEPAAAVSEPALPAPSETEDRETPVAEITPVAEPAAADPLEEVRKQFAAAKAAFTARNYGTSLELVDKVVAALPESNEALQFRSLVHFALGDDTAASADAYAALDSGPVWSRDLLTALYGDFSRYESQLRSLQVRAAERPDSVAIHFLLAYHSFLNGNLAAGETELQAILGINPDEPLARRLLQSVRDQQQTIAER